MTDVIPPQVRRGISHFLAHLGSPVHAPKPRGRSVGRPRGTHSPTARAPLLFDNELASASVASPLPQVTM